MIKAVLLVDSAILAGLDSFKLVKQSLQWILSTLLEWYLGSEGISRLAAPLNDGLEALRIVGEDY